MPSVVSFRNPGGILVGQTAKARLFVDPENTVASVKRFIGDRNKTYSVAGKSLSPVDISSLILRRIVAGAKEALKQDIWDAVITVPAYFTEAQKEDTKRAGEEAGLNVLRLLPEPTAAAIAYGLDKNKNQTIMVYDLGGGTFDVSILEVKNNNFKVKAVGGDSRLGGDDFDEAIMAWASKKFQAQTGIDLLNDNSRPGKIARQRLKEAAETAKIELSQTSNATLSIPDCLSYPLELEISRSEYNKLIEPLLGRTVNCMRSVLQDASLTPDDIDRVILVGGSTKNPIVREIVAREIKDPYTSERVDEVVSHGAAILAANLFLPSFDLKTIEVTAHSLGIDHKDVEKNKLYFQPIIARQTTYPCRCGRLAYTINPMQEAARMRVFRGEKFDPDENVNLGELTLPISPPQPEEVPVGAIFELDADGIIHFTAVQLPVSQSIASIIEYAGQHNGALDLAAVDSLIKSGAARTKVVQIESGL
jgi:molecular chaperone DnaK (HSP70)